MSSILVILLSICKLNLLSCEIAGRPKHLLSNSIVDNNNFHLSPYTLTAETVTTNGNDNEDIDNRSDFLNDPISSISIDYLNNALVLQFHKGYQQNDIMNDIDAKRRSPLDKNFMRFGRDKNDRSRMRFGKRQIEDQKDQKTISSDRSEYRISRSDSSSGVSRDARGDNFMRFGRADHHNNNNLMRFGRAGNGMMRFGRTVKQNLMRFGRSDYQQKNAAGFMRFGRTPLSSSSSLPSSSSSAQNLMRFGRSDTFNNNNRERSGFIRFGRGNNLMRFGRNDNNFMRFGKLDQNFMRFGKRNNINEIDELNEYMDLNIHNDTSLLKSPLLSSLLKSNDNDNNYKIDFNKKYIDNNSNNKNYDNQPDLIEDDILLSEQRQKQQLLPNDDLYSNSLELH